MKIAMLHLAPVVGDLTGNRDRIMAGIRAASDAGAGWVLMPELPQSGYDFVPLIGTEWVEPQPDLFMKGCMALAQERALTLFLPAAERDAVTGNLHNSLFVIGRNGELLGRHRKVNVIGGLEGWATPGTDMTGVEVDGIKVGLLICSDAYRAGPTARLKELGAQVLISAAAWCPKPHGPDGAWEQRSLETGLPLFVCNRTGMDRQLDFTESVTGYYHQGACLKRHVSPDPALVIVAWDGSKGR